MAWNSYPNCGQMWVKKLSKTRSVHVLNFDFIALSDCSWIYWHRGGEKISKTITLCDTGNSYPNRVRVCGKYPKWPKEKLAQEENGQERNWPWEKPALRKTGPRRKWPSSVLSITESLRTSPLVILVFQIKICDFMQNMQNFYLSPKFAQHCFKHHTVT